MRRKDPGVLSPDLRHAVHGQALAPSCLSGYLRSPCAAVWSRLPIRCVLHLLTGSRRPTAARSRPIINVAPSQLLYVIRENHETGERTLELLRWGLIPHGRKDPKEGVSRSTRVPNLWRGFRHFAPLMQSAAASCPSIVFLSGARSGARAKQPFAVAMEDRTPFAIGGVWENWRDPQSGVFMAFIIVVWFGWLVLMALDAKRWNLSHMPEALNYAGAVLIPIGFSSSSGSLSVRIHSQHR